MSIDYSDGHSIEERILQLLKQSPCLGSEAPVASEFFDEWPIRYHLCAERSNLVRHLDFTGLDVLELGAGMGGVSRFLAERCKSLTVVEGTESRFRALSERLRDLQNWKGMVANIQDVTFEPRFDVVCLIGVLEYSDIYIKPPEGFNGSPFLWLLKHAASFLKPDGVLVVAIENKLGLKYWNGAAEDHLGQMFQGICGYPNHKQSPRTFARKELDALLKSTGLGVTEFHYPFPDYKIPSSVISSRLIELNPELAAEIAIDKIFQNYAMPQVNFFPGPLAVVNIGQAGLLEDFSNSFLTFATVDSQSRTFNKLLRRRLVDSEVAWHYSSNRKSQVCTVFHEGSNRQISVSKEPVSDVLQSDVFAESSDFEVQWICPADGVIGPVRKLRTDFLRVGYFEGGQTMLEMFERFLAWSFSSWSLEGEWAHTHLRGEALDAIHSNVVVDVGGSWEFIDLEWKLAKPMPKSWFILRNILAFDSSFDRILGSGEMKSLGALYHKTCSRFAISGDLENDLLLESRLQRIVSSIDGSIEDFRQNLSRLMNSDKPDWPYPKHPLVETNIRVNHKVLESQKAQLEIQVHELMNRINYLEHHINSRVVRYAYAINNRLKKAKLIHVILKRVLGLFLRS